MSTENKTPANRTRRLGEYLLKLYRGNRSRDLYDRYADILTTAAPAEVNGAIHSLIEHHDDFDHLEETVARFIRAAATGLDSYPPPEVPPGHFIGLLMEENRALKNLLTRLSAAFKGYTKTPERGTEVKNLLRQTLDITSHYRKLQYPVFSAMEEYAGAFNCTKLMWHIQDSVLAGLKECIRMLESPENPDFGAFNRLFGRVYLQLGTLVYREEKILFPVVLEEVPGERFADMFGELEDYGIAFGVKAIDSVPYDTAAGAGNTYIRKKQEDSMSEHIRNHEERKEQLKEIILNLKNESDIPGMKKRFAALLKSLSPEEVAAAEQALIDEGMPVEDVQKLCEIHVTAFEDALAKTGKVRGRAHKLPGHPVHSYKEENKALKKKLRQLKPTLKGLRRSGGFQSLEETLSSLKEIERHYARKENQLFPFLEKVGFTGPSKVMWGKHDEIRGMIKDLDDALAGKDPEGCRKTAGSLIRGMKNMVLMEEKILFPTALRKLPEGAWSEIRRGEAEIGYAWITPGNLWDPSVVSSPVPASSVPAEPGNAEIELSVGRLLPAQIDLMLKNLPVDITYVDENDRVRYYSQGKERIFPRSPGIISRSVQNCHPPKSVHVVQKIVEDFKARRRDVADFWLELGGNFIYIRYFALFEGEVYRGVLEVSQNVTDIRKLEGEKRLLEEE